MRLMLGAFTTCKYLPLGASCRSFLSAKKFAMYTQLHKAASNGDLEKVKLLVGRALPCQRAV